MRRSFKVATVFTGVAAITGGLGPTALAATARIGSITNVPCGANNDGISTWVHMYYPNDDHSAECFGNWGSTPAKVTIASLCPGNNNGSATGSVADAGGGVITFHAGEGRHSDPYYDHIFSAYFRIARVDISGWTGDAKCLG